jgi:molybdenum-dependent DNA-binding transcriptional regulator ModE
MLYLSEQSLRLFLAYAEDAENWAGTPLVDGNVRGSKEGRGNLTDLKKKGLITTFQHNKEMFVEFTDAGIELAKEHGIIIEE